MSFDNAGSTTINSRIVNNAALNVGTAPFSMGCWVRANSTTRADYISRGINVAGTPNCVLFLTGAGATVEIFVRDTVPNAQSLISTATIATDGSKWNFIAATRNAAGLAILVDTVYKTAASTAINPNNNNDLFFGLTDIAGTKSFALRGQMAYVFYVAGIAFSYAQLQQIRLDYTKAVLFGGPKAIVLPFQSNSKSISGNKISGIDTALAPGVMWNGKRYAPQQYPSENWSQFQPRNSRMWQQSAGNAAAGQTNSQQLFGGILITRGQ